MDTEKAEKLVREMLEEIGENPDRDGLLDTPKRVVKSWGELYGGYSEDIQQHVRVFESDYDQMIVLGPIEYFSMCEHHMLPFFWKLLDRLPTGRREGARRIEAGTHRKRLCQEAPDSGADDPANRGRYHRGGARKGRCSCGVGDASLHGG